MDILVRYYSITESALTIALESKTAMDKSRGDWLLSTDQKYVN